MVSGGVRPVFARHAASLLVVRDGARGPEVLMGIRGAGHRFLPNRLVFPGGAVDPGDARAVAASEPDSAVLAVLRRRAGPGVARGLVMAAARELEEECGLSLGRPPALDGVDYLCRAVTPPGLPIRFNARFFVVDAARVEGVARDTRELLEVGFRSVAEVLDQGLMRVTHEVLVRLVAFLGMSAVERVGRSEFQVFKERSWLRD